MTQHELKIDYNHFEGIIHGVKNYELRFNDDRNFQVGDTLVLRETLFTAADMKKGFGLQYTGRFVTKKVSHVLTDAPGLQQGFAILSLE